MTSTDTAFAAGVYEMDEATYHGDPVPGGSLSSSGARRLLPPGCPALFNYERDHPRQRAEFDFGTAAHKLVLGTGPEIAVIDAKDWRTNKAKDDAKAARERGAVPVLTADYLDAQVMADAIRAHPLAGRLFNPEFGGKPEQSLFWQDDQWGIWKRARLDWLPDWTNAWGRLILADYKTTTCADPGHIAKAVANYGYHQQAAFYLDGVHQVIDGGDPAFLFVFQEKNPPYLVTVCELDHEAITAGRKLNDRAAEVFRDCTASGLWPSYSTEDVALISLPRWAQPREDYL